MMATPVALGLPSLPSYRHLLISGSSSKYINQRVGQFSAATVGHFSVAIYKGHNGGRLERILEGWILFPFDKNA